MDRSMIDAASGEALMEKTPAATRHLILNMAMEHPTDICPTLQETEPDHGLIYSANRGLHSRWVEAVATKTNDAKIWCAKSSDQ
ncbi:hypothetical protein CR513_54321, partial [Mucuna pruriens]